MKQLLQFKKTFLLSLIAYNLSAQVDTAWQQKPVFKISGYADVFYVFDFNQPKGTERQPFLVNQNRHNEFNLNLGIIKLGLEQARYRATVALHAGTYVNDNYAKEPELLKSISEARIGVSLNKKNNLWVDAGVLPSHIGFESAISIDQWTLTRSLLAENSPYFLTGAKLTYTVGSKLEIAGLILNGWQRIQRLPGNSLPSFGTQVNYSPTDKVMLNWSSFAGTDDPDTTRRMRYFSNLYGVFQLTEKWGLIIGFDIGTQQRIKNSSTYDLWFSPVFISQFAISPHWKTAFRAEYYQDKSGIIIPTGMPNGFRTSGISLNLDYSPTQHLVCRLEGRWLKSKDNIFETQTTPVNNNFILATSLAIRFSETVKK